MIPSIERFVILWSVRLICV